MSYGLDTVEGACTCGDTPSTSPLLPTLPCSPLVHVPLRVLMGTRHTTHPRSALCMHRDYMGPHSCPHFCAKGARGMWGWCNSRGGRRAHCPSCTPSSHANRGGGGRKGVHGPSFTCAPSSPPTGPAAR